MARIVAHKRYPDLRAWRLALGISQADAALLLGVSQTQYSRLERRTNWIKGPTAKRVMEKTGVPLEILTGAA